MVLPKYNDFYVPVIYCFADEKIHYKKEVLEYLIEYFELTKEDVQEKSASGKTPIFYSRVSWILSNLSRSGILEKQGRSLYSISKKGLKLVNKNPTIIKEEILRILKSERRDLKPIVNSINMDIENIGAISKSNINVGKINVIGGQNATGKSTASKLLYCFLKYSSENRQDYALKFVSEPIRRLTSMIRRKLSSELNKEDNMFLMKNSSRLRFNENMQAILDIYEKLKDIIYAMEFDSEKDDSNLIAILNEFSSIDELLITIEEDGEKLFDLIMEDLFESEFSNKLGGLVQFYGSFNNEDYKYVSSFSNGYDLYRYGDLFINDVFYIDSVSLLDINQVNSLNNTSHVQSLLNAIDKNANERNPIMDIKNPNIKEVEYKINNLINGQFEYDKGELKYFDEKGVECYMSNTASGIKQIGIIQLLLHHHKLHKNSFLIIDEPEVNLHPEWQIKLAEILVVLSKKLNIYIYINTHSPMFIEAMSLYSEKYDLLNDTNFYLTEKHDIAGYHFKKIDNKDMGAVYENLSRPYDDLDEVKAEILFKK